MCSFLTLTEAKEIASTAQISFIHTQDIIADVNHDGTIDLFCEVKIEFPNTTHSKLFFSINLRNVYLTQLSLDDLRVQFDDYLDNFIVTTTPQDTFDRERYSLGYCNSYDQPFPMADWLCNPQKFIVEHTSIIHSVQSFANEYFVKNFHHHPCFSPLQNHALRCRMA